MRTTNTLLTVICGWPLVEKKMKSRKSFLACKFRRTTSSQKAVASNGLGPRMPWRMVKDQAFVKISYSRLQSIQTSS